MADLDFLERSSPVQIVGGDELFAADVIMENGQKVLLVKASLALLNSLDVTDVITNTNGVQGALTVGTSAIEVKVGASRLSDRKSLTLFNNSNSTMYWGFNSSVTVSNGTPIAKNEQYAWRIGDVPIFVISGSASSNARVTEA